MPETKTTTTSATTSGATTGSARASAPPVASVEDKATRVRVPVQLKPRDTLFATQATTTEQLTLPNGFGRLVYPGEWIISRQDRVIDVLPESAFAQFYEPVRQGLFVPQTIGASLERTLGIGAMEHPLALLAAVDRLASLHIGTLRIDFTPGQWEELKHRAEKNGTSLEAEIERIVARLREDIFWAV